MKKQLNFYPITAQGCNYQELIRQKKKWTTVRLGDRYAKDYQVGDLVDITCGFDPSSAQHVADGIIIRVELKKFGTIKDDDLEGKSPDSLTKPLLLSTLNTIYQERFRKGSL